MSARSQVVPIATSITDRVESIDWERVARELDAQGASVIDRLLTRSECTDLSACYSTEGLFRSRVEMAKHGFGRGEYKYFAYPLPDIVSALRTSLYPRLAPTANAWHTALVGQTRSPRRLRPDIDEVPNARTPTSPVSTRPSPAGDAAKPGTDLGHEAPGLEVQFPETHSGFVQRCHAAGQLRPTPLILQYGEGDYNCLHQDLYGEHVFPLQVAILLSEPERDFTGGEFVMTEQRPRMQSRPMVLPLRQGDALVFAVQHRPVPGKRGNYRVNLRHGVSQVRSGHRHTLGIIFHDAT